MKLLGEARDMKLKNTLPFLVFKGRRDKGDWEGCFFDAVVVIFT